MASGYTNRGKFLILQGVFRNTGLPTNYFVALATSATTPLSTHTTFSSLTEIAAGNGYTSGGVSLTKNSTDFDVLTEAATTLIQIKDVCGLRPRRTCQHPATVRVGLCCWMTT